MTGRLVPAEGGLGAHGQDGGSEAGHCDELVVVERG
jgi:hypothetical protein